MSQCWMLEPKSRPSFRQILNKLDLLLEDGRSSLTYIRTSMTQTLMAHSPGVSRELGGSVVECLTGDRKARGSSLTGVTVLCP